MARAQASIFGEIERLIPQASRLLVAVSGGIDSVVLLRALQLCQRKLKLYLEVAHVDHNLRPDSAADADFVKGLALEAKIDCHCIRATPPKEGTNIEAWGRELRYGYFAKIKAERKLDWTLTAHQANDCAETLLMRILSNKETRSILEKDSERALIRPFLRIPRDTVLSFAQEHKLTWREDVTNSDSAYLRNRVRNTLLPVLQENFDPNIVSVLALRAETLSADSHALWQLAKSEIGLLGAINWADRTWFRALKDKLLSLEPAIAWRLAALALAPQLGFELGQSHAERVVEFVIGGSEGIELPTGLQLRRQAGAVLVEPPSQI